MGALLLLLISLPAAAADYGSDDFIKSRFPLPAAVKGVSSMQKGAAFGPGPKISPTGLDCGGTEVFAASPGQYTKSYHADAFVFYDEQKVPGTKEVTPENGAANLPGNYVGSVVLCKVAQTNNAMNPATGDHWCQQAKVGRYTMMSDFFYCRNGDDIRFYRGYWESAAIYQSYNARNLMQTFRTENEHIMTTSLARGDTMSDAGDGTYTFVPGPTFGEKKNRFLFFTKATDADILQIDAAISSQTGPKGAYEQCSDGNFQLKGQCAKH